MESTSLCMIHGSRWALDTKWEIDSLKTLQRESLNQSKVKTKNQNQTTRKGRKPDTKDTGKTTKRYRRRQQASSASNVLTSRCWCCNKSWSEMAWRSSLGKPAVVYSRINWSRPWRTRCWGNAPLMTMWHRERNPLSRTFGGDAENGDKTWDVLVGPW